MAISPDSQMLAAAGHHSIRIYDINCTEQEPLCNIEASTKNITGLGYQEDGKWMYGTTEDGSVKVWDSRYAYSIVYHHNLAKKTTYFKGYTKYKKFY